MLSSTFRDFFSLGAGVTPAQGSVKPTVGFTLNRVIYPSRLVFESRVTLARPTRAPLGYAPAGLGAWVEGELHVPAWGTPSSMKRCAVTAHALCSPPNIFLAGASRCR